MIRGTTESDYDMNEYTETEIKLCIFQLLSLADSCCRSPFTVRAPLGEMLSWVTETGTATLWTVLHTTYRLQSIHDQT